jgi:SPOR domain
VTPCPECGEPTERGQLVCVNCGARLALRRPPAYAGPPRSAIPALVILLAVVVIGAGAVGFALSEITSGDDDGGGGGHAQSNGGGQSQTTQTSTTQTETATGEQRSTSPLLEWPKGVTGYTVVLVTTADHAAARRVALEASQSGLEAGLLRSDDYDLGTGLWIVFAGRFDTRESAGRQAQNLADRYPGAYAQLVKPVS